MTKRLQTVGNSAGVIIDKPIRELLRITPETELDISTDGNRVIITPMGDGKAMPTGNQALILELLRITQDTELDISTDGERLVITPVRDRKPKLGGNQPLSRRNAIKLAFGLALAVELAPKVGAVEGDSRNWRPQPGDQLVFAEGERRGTVISPAHVRIDGPQLQAFPVDPRSGVIRDGSRLNKVLLVRLPSDALSDELRRRSVEGVSAYSAVCTHQGCEVTAWDVQTKTLWCPCHDSKYDPRESARVVAGPAPRRLAALPLKSVDGVLTVAGGFTGPVGFQNR
ncbi:MAG TPA: Rieske 2Fe-2S domain-containing protein [Burkholderiales bacterium]|nr:Rieske 2Fe-2S domain-containing protein [Burkholderiales bacterium]